MDREYIQIIGGRPLSGSIALHGAKNAVLPLLAASMLSDEPVRINNCPYISDVTAMAELLGVLGLNVEKSGRTITVSGAPVMDSVPERMFSGMRSSMFMLGALLARTGEVRIPLPGGCNIGARPLDIHLDGLQKMGADIECGADYVRCAAQSLHGAQVVMRYPSVGATENLIMAAVTAQGDTTVINCAREPEIVSLVEGLRAMGACISGEGTSVIRIKGVKKLYGADITPIGDRIVCGTLLAAVGACGGSVDIEGVGADKLEAVICAMRSNLCHVVGDEYGVHIHSEGRGEAKHIVTGPYPLFPTDMQPQLTAYASVCKGISSVCETVFESRFAHIGELRKMGAKIFVNGNTVTIEGDDLCGAQLNAADLRGGAGLIVAALAGEGESKIYNTVYIDRGYEEIENMFSALGANIVRKCPKQ